MINILPQKDKEAIIAAADAAGATRVLARISWLQTVLIESVMPFPVSQIRPETQIASMRCTPGPCIELWAVNEWAINDNWIVA